MITLLLGNVRGECATRATTTVPAIDGQSLRHDRLGHWNRSITRRLTFCGNVLFLAALFALCGPSVSAMADAASDPAQPNCVDPTSANYGMLYVLNVDFTSLTFPFSFYSGKMQVHLQAAPDGGNVANVHDDESGDDWNFQVFLVRPCRVNEFGQSVPDTQHVATVGERITLHGTLPPGFPPTDLGATTLMLRDIELGGDVRYDVASDLGSFQRRVNNPNDDDPGSGRFDAPPDSPTWGSIVRMVDGGYLVSEGSASAKTYQVTFWAGYYLDKATGGNLMSLHFSESANGLHDVPADDLTLNVQHAPTILAVKTQQAAAQAAADKVAQARSKAAAAAAAQTQAQQRAETAAIRKSEEKADQAYLASLSSDQRSVVKREFNLQPCHVLKSAESGLDVVIWEFCYGSAIHLYRFENGQLTRTVTGQ